MRYNGVITLPNLNPEKYLTKDILSKISLAVKGKEKDLDKQAYLLKDGTLIMIERPIAGMTGDGCTLYNPKDIFGKNCQTANNLSHYEYSDGFKIDIPENSCFVNTCCMIGHRFRTHENYDSLNAKLQKIVDNYNSNNSERQISYTKKKHLWYNEYTIGY